ncbi:MAG: hypothetical protein KKH22_11855 [Proteobacteria bacterium]|nr:hypothetical protein [Pseudomonadota bacterium]
MQFVLRLRPDIHKKISKIPSGIVTGNKYDVETFQAYSTYFHETLHWWQHIGSVSGFILSLTYPAQTHVNHKHLKDYLHQTGAIKSIVKYNKIFAKEYNPNSNEFKTINLILNNFHDIEFFKYLTINPKSAESICKDSLFESVGHSYYIAYSSFINLLSASFDNEFLFLPNPKKWIKGFGKLRENKVSGYYFGSNITLPRIGLKEIYEGQARFSQIQYLYFGSGGNLAWIDFEELGMLSGDYYKAFAIFLELIESKRPDSIDSPLVALFLVVLDIAMNPGEGFPFEIIDYEYFINSTDPGLRFTFLCVSIRENYPDLKTFIKDYSNSEYLDVVSKLSAAINSPSPLDVASCVLEWADHYEELVKLKSEEKHFTFSAENQPIRLLFSRFLRYQEDKLNNPAYFCWPGAHSAGERCTDVNLKLFLEHQSLFTDKADGDIYPRIFPDKNMSSVKESFDIFYTWVVTYDLCRQWIIDDGPFKYDYFWLSSKHSKETLEEWARRHFKFAYGVDTTEFEIAQEA